MSLHKFKIGDVVTYAQQFGPRADGAYEVIRLLPSDSPEPTYRLKSQIEKHERVAREFELRAVAIASEAVMAKARSPL